MQTQPMLKGGDAEKRPRVINNRGVVHPVRSPFRPLRTCHRVPRRRGRRWVDDGWSSVSPNHISAATQGVDLSSDDERKRVQFRPCLDAGQRQMQKQQQAGRYERAGA